MCSGGGRCANFDRVSGLRALPTWSSVVVFASFTMRRSLRTMTTLVPSSELATSSHTTANRVSATATSTAMPTARGAR